MNSLVTDIAHRLTDRHETLAVAESCTGGYIANQLTNIPGASAWFERGAVCYSNASKIQWLGVAPHIIDRGGAVGSECAEAMAMGIRKVAATTYGISVTGIAGPDGVKPRGGHAPLRGGSPEKPVGTVFIGLATPAGCSVIEHHFSGDRETFKSKVSEAALGLLKEYLK